jgi:cell division protein FtsQ
MWDDAKALSGIAATLVAMAVAALIASAIAWLARQPAFAIREVVVTTPLARASAPHLEAVIREEIRGTFFTLDLERARAAIGKVPWVRGVALRRQWPQRLEIAIEEHLPLARLGEDALVNTFGETFTASYAGALPRFAGPEGYAREITDRYREWSAVLAPLALDVIELAMSPRGGWRVRALGSEGPLTLELGRDEASARLQRFVAVHANTIGALARQGTRIEHVDLRYRNGFAVRVPGFREPAARIRG